MKKILATFSILLFGVALAAGVSEATIKRDLTGQRIFWNYVWTQGGDITVIQKVEKMRILKRRTNSGSGTDFIQMELQFLDSTYRYKGNINLKYQKYDQGWEFESMAESPDNRDVSNVGVKNFRFTRSPR